MERNDRNFALPQVPRENFLNGYIIIMYCNFIAVALHCSLSVFD